MKLEKAFEAQERVNGTIFNQVKGGYTVDLDGAVAFLPRSQVDIRPVRDVTPLMGVAQAVPDPQDGPPPRQHRRVAPHGSRREPRRAAFRARGEPRRGSGSSTAWSRTSPSTVRSLISAASTACCTSPTWHGAAVNHPSEVVTIGQTVKVKIIKINHETHRISLGIKQLLADPWKRIAARYPVQAKLKGRVTNITDYGAFVELEPGIEGLIHVSEMSWTKKNVHPGKIISTSQEVEVVILEVDQVKRRICWA